MTRGWGTNRSAAAPCQRRALRRSHRICHTKPRSTRGRGGGGGVAMEWNLRSTFRCKERGTVGSGCHALKAPPVHVIRPQEGPSGGLLWSPIRGGCLFGEKIATKLGLSRSQPSVFRHRIGRHLERNRRRLEANQRRLEANRRRLEANRRRLEVDVFLTEKKCPRKDAMNRRLGVQGDDGQDGSSPYFCVSYRREATRPPSGPGTR